MIIKWTTASADNFSGLNSITTGVHDTEALWHISAAVDWVVVGLDNGWSPVPEPSDKGTLKQDTLEFERYTIIPISKSISKVPVKCWRYCSGFNSLKPSDAYTRHYTNHNMFI